VETLPESNPRPIGRYFALPLAGASVFLMAANGGLNLIVKLFLRAEGAPPIVVGAVTSVSAAGVILGSLAWGRLADRRERRPLLFATVLGAVGAIGVLILLPPPWLVIGSVFVRTVMWMGFSTVTMAIVSGASAVARRGRNLSYVTSARSLGFALGAIASGYVLERFGFRGGFAVMAILPLLGIGFLFLLPAGEAAPAPVMRRGSWRLAFSSGLVDLYLSTILRQMAIHGAFSLLPIYMAALGIPPIQMGLVTALNTLTQVGALIGFGRLADRIGRRRIFMLGFALSALTPCVFAFARHAAGMAAGYGILGLSFSSLYIGSAAHIGDRVPEERQGAMLGLYETSRGIGGLVGPLLAGAITSVLGYTGMFFTMAGIAGVGFLVMFIRREYGRMGGDDGRAGV